MPQQLETIIQDAVLGQDCSFSLATATYSGTVVNLMNMGAQFSYRQESFEPATSATAGAILTKEERPNVTVSVYAGLNSTFVGFYRNVYGKLLTDFDMTDFPSYAEMTARYGTAHVSAISKTQGGGPGTFDVTISWATKTHGYNAA